ncbi:hypothetical protein GY45DRAFT_169875 [Cubamyces sp. BRFM 1775]|nr:hypothetical protein GY45DRAFT_169875 [Cubamyces sp. BRFM 1775]
MDVCSGSMNEGAESSHSCTGTQVAVALGLNDYCYLPYGPFTLTHGSTLSAINVTHDECFEYDTVNNAEPWYQMATDDAAGLPSLDAVHSYESTQAGSNTLFPDAPSFQHTSDIPGHYVIPQDAYGRGGATLRKSRSMRSRADKLDGGTVGSTPIVFRIPAQEALSPCQSELEAIARGWLEPALVGTNSPADNEQRRQFDDRRDRKFTIRLKVKGCTPGYSKQYSEYTTGRLIRNFASWFKPSHTKAPITKLELAHIVADFLRKYMSDLELDGKPLELGGRKVFIEHVEITSITRRTVGSLQPTLSILPEYRHLYWAVC